MNESLVDLNDCGCCEGIEPQTPAVISNQPGLHVVTYRVGTHTQFKASLIAALSASDLPGAKGLRTRDAADFSLALLDAWATVLDVLAFYQERRANEHYLRTATERWSIQQLAGLIGYRLKPGVAASTYLAFTIEDAPGSPDETVKHTVVPVGTKVQSIPGPGEQPQIFETVKEIVARPQWNAIRPRLTRRHPIERDPSELLFDGLSVNLKQGDVLLLQPDQQNNRAVLKWIQEVTLETKEQRTRVRLVPDLRREVALPSAGAASIGRRLNFRQRSSFFKPFMERIDSTTLSFKGRAMGIDSDDLFSNLKVSQPAPPSVSVFRTKAAVFGHNAPEWENLSDIQIFGRDKSFPDSGLNLSTAVLKPFIGAADEILRKKAGLYGYRQNSWAEDSLEAYQNYLKNNWGFSNGTLMLDRVYPDIVKGTWILMQDGNSCHLHRADAIAETSFADFTLSAKCTRISLDSSLGFETCTIRGTTVFANSEALPLARQPILSAVHGNSIELDTFVEGLYEGQSILIRGEDETFHGRMLCEQTVIEKVEVLTGDDGFVTITVEPALTHRYIRDTVTIYANVAPATHGETVSEALGSGDATQSYQRFTLKQPPLTYLSAPVPGGRESTLRVYVNDLQWHEASSLYGAKPTDRLFIVSHTDDGRTVLQTGDGQMGGRLPSGLNNVRAVYRKGVGQAGNLKAGQLSMLLSRSLGVKEAKNYTSAVGGDDGERPEDARCNAPFTVKTLDRVVSLQDHEDFCLTFAGVSKALAVWTTDGVFLTLSGPAGAEIDPQDSLGRNLLAALRKAGDPHIPITLATYRPAFFEVRPRVTIDPDRESARVLVEAESRLRHTFSFDVRSFGQPVTLSEVVAVLQSTSGVVAVEIDTFQKVPSPVAIGSALPPERLFAEVPISGRAVTVSAELLLLSERKIDFAIMS